MLTTNDGVLEFCMFIYVNLVFKNLSKERTAFLFFNFYFIFRSSETCDGWIVTWTRTGGPTTRGSRRDPYGIPFSLNSSEKPPNRRPNRLIILQLLLYLQIKVWRSTICTFLIGTARCSTTVNGSERRIQICPRCVKSICYVSVLFFKQFSSFELILFQNRIIWLFHIARI